MKKHTVKHVVELVSVGEKQQLEQLVGAANTARKVGYAHERILPMHGLRNGLHLGS